MVPQKCKTSESVRQNLQYKISHTYKNLNIDFLFYFWKCEKTNKPDRQVVKQEQVQDPIIDLLVHTVKHLSFYQKLEDFAPQMQLPTKWIILLPHNGERTGVYIYIYIPYLYFCFRRQFLQAVAKSTILTELCTTPFCWSKKFCNCWFWGIIFLLRWQTKGLANLFIFIARMNSENLSMEWKPIYGMR